MSRTRCNARALLRGDGTQKTTSEIAEGWAPALQRTTSQGRRAALRCVRGPRAELGAQLHPHRHRERSDHGGQSIVRRDRLAVAAQSCGEALRLGREDVHHVEPGFDGLGDLHTVGQFADDIAIGDAEAIHENTKARLDAELLH
ncbi:hypothetical protein XH88_33280 [Bradyrhizobium sp. CCBAU 51627]|nr:hypothetical protein [Bradyrhizobium sp. CCBAU 51627]